MIWCEQCTKIKSGFILVQVKLFLGTQYEGMFHLCPKDFSSFFADSYQLIDEKKVLKEAVSSPKFKTNISYYSIFLIVGDLVNSFRALLYNRKQPYQWAG